jgi:hypothetical protein
MATWPKPHEGISGAPWTRDHLLNIDETGLKWRVGAMERLYQLWGDSLHPIEGAAGLQLFNRMDSPVVGDVVMEVTSFFRLQRDAEYRRQGFGVLLGMREEWDQGRAEKAWYIQYGPEAEDVCRWVNCKFIAVPPSRLHALMQGA